MGSAAARGVGRDLHLGWVGVDDAHVLLRLRALEHELLHVGPDDLIPRHP